MSASAGRDETFDRIRSEISRELSPVRPLSSGRLRALFVLPYFALALAILLLVFGLRPDAQDLGGGILWGLAALQLLVAYSIFIVALRQAVPGDAVGPAVWLSIPLLVIFMQVGVALWTYRYSPLDVPSDHVYVYGPMCFAMMTLFGVAPVAIAFWLLGRGLPLRPPVAGLVTGLGSGLVAEAVYRTHCSYSHWTHILPWHGGAVLLLGLLGLYCGFLWEKRRLREYEHDHRP